MAKTKKVKPKVKKVFDEFIKLYDIADELENDGKGKEAKDMKHILNTIGSFILNQ